MKLAQSLILAIAAATSEDDNSLLQNVANRQLLMNNCERITTVAQCKDTAEKSDYKFKQAKLWKTRPHGCIQRIGRNGMLRGVSFNIHPGMPNSNYQTVCLQNSPSSDSEPEGVEDIADAVINEAESVDPSDVLDTAEDAVDAAVDADADDIDNAIDTAEETVNDIANQVDTNAVADAVGDAVEGEVDGAALAHAVSPVMIRLVEAISSGSVEDGLACTGVEKGDVAPMPGQYRSNSGNFIPVEDAAVAPKDGEFCVEIDTTNLDDVQAAIMSLEPSDTDICFDVSKGDAAPFRGVFTRGDNEKTDFVKPGDVASVDGEYCIELF